jgi:hypothetical protein
MLAIVLRNICAIDTAMFPLKYKNVLENYRWATEKNKSSHLSQIMRCALCKEQPHTPNNRIFSRLWCSWSPSVFLNDSRLLWLYVVFLFLCSFHLFIWKSRVRFIRLRGQCRIGAQPRWLFGRRPVSLVLRSAFSNRKQHAIDCDQPQSRAIWQTELKGHYSEVPFWEVCPSKSLGTREVEDCRPKKSRFSWGSC